MAMAGEWLWEPFSKGLTRQATKPPHNRSRRSGAAIPRFGRRCCWHRNTPCIREQARSCSCGCGYAIGLEAAHIKWFQARGPDVVQDGLALCSLHHKIFDLGAFTVLPGNHQIVFSRHLMGGDDTKAKLLAHHGAGLIQPQGRECLPHAEFLAWHRAEVFKEPARE